MLLASLSLRPRKTGVGRVDEVAGFLTEESVSQTQSKFDDLSVEVEGYLNAYAETVTFDQSAAAIQVDIAALNSGSLKVATSMAEEAREHVATARQSSKMPKVDSVSSCPKLARRS